MHTYRLSKFVKSWKSWPTLIVAKIGHLCLQTTLCVADIVWGIHRTAKPKPVGLEVNTPAVSRGHHRQAKSRPISRETKPPAVVWDLHRTAKPKPVGQEVNTPAVSRGHHGQAKTRPISWEVKAPTIDRGPLQAAKRAVAQGHQLALNNVAFWHAADEHIAK